MTQVSEFSRVIKLDRIPQDAVTITATSDEVAALARRFGLPSVKNLSATVKLVCEGREIGVSGTLIADVEQACAISGEPFANHIVEPIAFRFVPRTDASPTASPDEEIELDSDQLDEIEYDGAAFDLGEAIAQSLALAIDPYATGPNAEVLRREQGITGDDAPSGPFAALAQLKDMGTDADR